MFRRLLAIVAILLLALAAMLAWEQLDQPLRVVRVEGPLSVAEQQAVREVVSSVASGGLLSMDLDAVCAEILALSWPREVRLRRVWPHSLIISVDREALVASWGRDGYLTSAGKIVHLPDIAADLPVLDAQLSSPRQAMELYQMLQKQLDVGGLRIQKLSENALGEWQLTLAGGLTVALGNDFLTERLNRFLTVYRQVLQEEPQSGVHADARYGNGVAVSRSPSLLALEGASSMTENDESSEYGFGQ